MQISGALAVVNCRNRSLPLMAVSTTSNPHKVSISCIPFLITGESSTSATLVPKLFIITLIRLVGFLYQGLARQSKEGGSLSGSMVGSFVEAKIKSFTGWQKIQQA